MSSWLLIIFLLGLSVTLGYFPSKFLKCSFHTCICSSWLAAFSLAMEVLFLLLTRFTIYHTIWDCLSLTEFLILLIWLWMFSICSFSYALISSLCAFLSFSEWMALLGFFLLHKDAVFLFYECWQQNNLFLKVNLVIILYFILFLIIFNSFLLMFNSMTMFKKATCHIRFQIKQDNFHGLSYVV